MVSVQLTTNTLWEVPTSFQDPISPVCQLNGAPQSRRKSFSTSAKKPILSLRHFLPVRFASLSFPPRSTNTLGVGFLRTYPSWRRQRWQKACGVPRNQLAPVTRPAHNSRTPVTSSPWQTERKSVVFWSGQYDSVDKWELCVGRLSFLRMMHAKKRNPQTSIRWLSVKAERPLPVTWSLSRHTIMTM